MRIYKRFGCWPRRGVWPRLRDASGDAGVITTSSAVGGTDIKAQRATFGGKGERQVRAIARSRGDWTTEVPARIDVIGRRDALTLTLTAGNVIDVTPAPPLLERAGRLRYLRAEKGYDADRLRRSLRDAGTAAVIPGRRNRKRALRDEKERYRRRHLIENAFGLLKGFGPAATRYQKSPPTSSQA